MTSPKKPEEGRTALRITDQFHKNGGTVYDFRCENEHLSLFMSPRTGPDDEGDWRIEAKASSAPNDVLVAWGPSRAEALRLLGEAWTEQRVERRLPSFDWDAVAKALTAVRGI